MQSRVFSPYLSLVIFFARRVGITFVGDRKTRTNKIRRVSYFGRRTREFEIIRVREAIFRAYDYDKYNKYRTFDASDSLFNNTRPARLKSDR